jgi:Conserved oligomeric complex COG6
MLRCILQILETRTESPELQGSLSTLSTFYAVNSLAERRQLRATIEKQGLAVNEDFLAAAGSVISVCSPSLIVVLPSVVPIALWLLQNPCLEAGTTSYASTQRFHPGSCLALFWPCCKPRGLAPRNQPSLTTVWWRVAAAQALEVVQADLDGLSTCCERISGALSSSKQATSELLAETEKLTRALAMSTKRSQLVEKFLQQYQLSHDEVYALQVGARGRR